MTVKVEINLNELNEKQKVWYKCCNSSYVLKTY